MPLYSMLHQGRRPPQRTASLSCSACSAGCSGSRRTACCRLTQGMPGSLSRGRAKQRTDARGRIAPSGATRRWQRTCTVNEDGQRWPPFSSGCHVDLAYPCSSAGCRAVCAQRLCNFLARRGAESAPSQAAGVLHGCAGCTWMPSWPCTVTRTMYSPQPAVPTIQVSCAMPVQQAGDWCSARGCVCTSCMSAPCSRVAWCADSSRRPVCPLPGGRKGAIMVVVGCSRLCSTAE